MTDEALRALERAARTGGGPAVLRYVAELERLGRPTDALRALSAAYEQPEVLAEIRRRVGPVRATPPENTQWSPGPALAARPRLAWTHDLRLGRAHGTRDFLGNPFGLVLIANETRADEEALFAYLLDPGTGELRRPPVAIHGNYEGAALVGATLLVRAFGPQGFLVRALDLFTGDELWTRAEPAYVRSIAERGRWGCRQHEGYVDVCREDANGEQVEVWRTTRSVTTWTFAPEFAVIAEHEIERRSGSGLHVLASSLVVVGEDGEIGRLRSPSGEVVEHLATCEQTIYAVRHRAWATPRADAELLALDTGAHVLWTLPLAPATAPRHAVALPSRLLAIHERHGIHIHCFEPAPA